MTSPPRKAWLGVLEPRDRQLMFEAFQPPVGYRFDQGMGTTYSMDLLALMMAPVAFTFFDLRQGEDGPAHSSLEVLEGLRRHADRLTLFCEAGRIAIPKGRYPQLAFVEDSVVQCPPPEKGAFHPKLWVLRFLGEGPTRYRVLCLSRNLMFCRAWDTMLTLDGEVKGRTVANNRPLSDFVKALPGFADRPATESVTARAALLAEELLSTDFELPEGADAVRFWPLGHTSRRAQPFKDVGKRLLIVSPFISLTTIENLAAGTQECAVVSTLPELGSLARRPEGVTKFYVLNERAVTESEETTAALSDSMADAIAQGDLHAKLYVTEFGAEAHVWTGSLNASEAALKRNVEFLVELIGPRKRFGIDALMAPEKDSVRLINLIRDVTDANVVATQASDPDVDKLEARLDEIRAALINAKIEATAEGAADGSFTVRLGCRSQSAVQVDADLDAHCWPVSTESRRLPFLSCESGGTLLKFPQLSFEALTTFFAFEIGGRVSGVERQLRFVLNLPLIGAPTDRKERALRSFLTDRGRFLKFLMLLLADEGFDPRAFGDAFDENRSGGDEGSNATAVGLLEMLLHALDTSPNRLDHLHSLLQQVTTDAEGRALLPLGFQDIWDPIWAARLERPPQEVRT